MLSAGEGFSALARGGGEGPSGCMRSAGDAASRERPHVSWQATAQPATTKRLSQPGNIVFPDESGAQHHREMKAVRFSNRMTPLHRNVLSTRFLFPFQAQTCHTQSGLSVVGFPKHRRGWPTVNRSQYYFKSLMPYRSRAVLFYGEERRRRRSGATSSLCDEARGQKRREIVALRF